VGYDAKVNNFVRQAMDGDKCVGAVVCKLDMHKRRLYRGYIAMLAVDSDYRGKGIGSQLVIHAVSKMKEHNCDEVRFSPNLFDIHAISDQELSSRSF
jgi:ribosomal protein S18 acetylase RimI-like enzyme